MTSKCFFNSICIKIENPKNSYNTKNYDNFLTHLLFVSLTSSSPYKCNRQSSQKVNYIKQLNGKLEFYSIQLYLNHSSC